MASLAAFWKEHSALITVGVAVLGGIGSGILGINSHFDYKVNGMLMLCEHASVQWFAPCGQGRVKFEPAPSFPLQIDRDVKGDIKDVKGDIKDLNTKVNTAPSWFLFRRSEFRSSRSSRSLSC